MFRKTIVGLLVLLLMSGVTAMALDLGAGLYWHGEDAQIMTRLDTENFSLEAPAGTDLGTLTPGIKFDLGFLDNATEMDLSAVSDAYFTSKVEVIFYDDQQQANVYFDTYQIGLGMPPIRFKQFRIRGEFMVEDPLDDNNRELVPQLVLSYVF